MKASIFMLLATVILLIIAAVVVIGLVTDFIPGFQKFATQLGLGLGEAAG